ncbi:MAG: zinc-ribbon domain-containing protein [Deltaproteobacteria bacterium]|nr:zinc-ribbon domain-containing protein [Deltaproteobacteria bacterium]
MIITCKECGTDFNLDKSLLKESGSKVRCRKCKNIFVAYPSVKKTDKPTVTVAADNDKENAQKIEPQKENEDPSSSNQEIPSVEENTEPKIEDLELDWDIKRSEIDRNSKEMGPGIEIDADNLHLSDTENIEPYKEATDNENQTDLKDLDLEFDLELEPDEDVAEPDTLLEDQKKELQVDELDLSDLEIIFDESEEFTDEKSKTDIENLELELDMALEPEHEKDEMTEDDLDLSDLEIRFDEEPDDANASLESKHRDLEPESESEQFSDNQQRPQENEFSQTGLKDEYKSENNAFYDEPTVEKRDESPAETVDTQGHGDQPSLDTLKIEISDAHIKEDPVFDDQTQTNKKQTTGILFLVLIIAALVALGAYGAFTFIKPVNTFISNLFNTEVQKDAGEIRINPIKESINGKFVENTKAGRLFVITGRVKNESDQTGGFVRIAGNLFTKGEILVKTKRVYCGNELSDIDLANLDPAEINKRLLNPYGDNKINAEIKPGNDIPFMIVFSNLPDDLVNFTVEVEKPSQKTNPADNFNLTKTPKAVN